MNKLLRSNTKAESIQFLIMTFIWILIFALPLLTRNTSEEIIWHQVFKIWTEYGVVFVVFVINHFLLFPQFLKGRRILYFTSVLFMLGLVVVAYFLITAYTGPAGGQPPTNGDPLMNGRPPMDGQSSFGGRPGGPPRGRGPRELMPPYANMLIFSILLIGFDTGLSFAGKWLQAEQNKIVLEKENVENKMAFLQNQVSPHFFMNTLNNIHALVDIDTEEAKEAIIRLSQMMAYMLYESQTEKIQIQKEIGFIKSYVELMKLRFSEEVEVKLEIPETLPDITVPPLLTISFIENAFKHGISYEAPSFVHLKYVFKRDRMYFQVKNSNHAKTEKIGNSGIGLENARKRLALLYKNYDLKIENDIKELYTVNLNIPV